jgi:hypothetical protein
MNEIDTGELEQLLIEKGGEGYTSDNIRLLERNVSDDAFIDVPGVKPYDQVLDERYGTGNWAKLRRDETEPGHWDIVAYIEQAKDPNELEPDDVLWSKADGLRNFTLLRGGRYGEEKEK